MGNDMIQTFVGAAISVAVVFGIGPIIIDLVQDPYASPTTAVHRAVNALSGLVPLIYYGGSLATIGYIMFRRLKG